MVDAPMGGTGGQNANANPTTNATIHLEVPRAHAPQLLDGLRQGLTGMQSNEQLRGWMESDLIQPLEHATRLTGVGGEGTRSSPR